MANVMSMESLRAPVTRSGFDLGKRIQFTAKVGELLPVYSRQLYPDDHFPISTQWFTRTQPAATCANTRVKEYFDWFFVPENLLWNNFNAYVTSMDENTQHASDINSPDVLNEYLPYLTTSQIATYINKVQTSSKTPGRYNFLGYDRAFGTYKIMHLLGYGSYYPYIAKADQDSGPENSWANHKMFNQKMNPFKLLAYQKICEDYFRRDQWQRSAPYKWNINYVKANSNLPIEDIKLVDDGGVQAVENMFDMNYASWNLDYFMGVQPRSQFGDVAAVPLGGSGDVKHAVNIDKDYLQYTDTDYGFENTGYVYYKQTNAGYSNFENHSPSKNQIRLRIPPEAIEQINQGGAQLSVLALRQAEFLQRWKEVVQSGNQDYRTQIEKRFGYKPSAALSDMSTWIGGETSTVTFSEIVNATNVQSGSIYGKGAGSGDGFVDFKAPCHGVLMCIYHAVPLLDYEITGAKKENCAVTVQDFAEPSFDKIGMQQTHILELINTPELKELYSAVDDTTINDVFLGYAPRYADLKTDIDEVYGNFLFGDANWAAPLTSKYFMDYIQAMYQIDPSGRIWNANILKINPNILDTIFSVKCDSSVTSDQLKVVAGFGINAVRKFDYNGLPY